MGKRARKRLKSIADQVLKAASMPEVLVHVHEQRESNLRFANNHATTSGDTESLSVRVEVSQGGRTASVSGNNVSADGLSKLVARAEELCRLSPVDPEYMPVLPAQTYETGETSAHDAKTAKLNAEGRAQLATKMIRTANLRKLTTAGLVIASEQAEAVASSAGLFAFHTQTNCQITQTCRTKDGTGSGWAGAVHRSVGELDPEAVAVSAADKAEMSANPSELKPGRYVVLLEPQAVGDLLGFLYWSLSARSADEGRSFFTKVGGGNRLGEVIFHPSVTIRSDPTHRLHPSRPYAGDGQPRGRVTWISRGKLNALATSRYWAKKQGTQPQPGPGSMHMQGTTKSLLDLMRGVESGVLVTRFWYNRMLDPRTILATGLTRDGTFEIKNGKINRSLKNMRYNDSPVTLLQNTLAVGQPQRVVTRSGSVVVVPPLVVEGFNFASVSDAV